MQTNWRLIRMNIRKKGSLYLFIVYLRMLQRKWQNKIVFDYHLISDKTPHKVNCFTTQFNWLCRFKFLKSHKPRGLLHHQESCNKSAIASTQTKQNHHMKCKMILPARNYYAPIRADKTSWTPGSKRISGESINCLKSVVLRMFFPNQYLIFYRIICSHSIHKKYNNNSI